MLRPRLSVSAAIRSAMAEQRAAEALAAVLGVGGEHVHVPGAGCEVLQFLQRPEDRRACRPGPTRVVSAQRVADQAGGGAAAVVRG